MRKLTILLILLVAMSYADVLFDHSYDGTIDDGCSYTHPIITADDFTLSNPGRIEVIEWWALYPHAPTGDDYVVIIYDDNNGKPGLFYDWSVTVSPTLTDTGDDCFGQDIYHHLVTLDPADYFLAEGGTMYWLALSSLASNTIYWAAWDGGNLHHSTDGGHYWQIHNLDAMFRLSGTDNYSSIEEATWGQLKAAHSFAD